VRPAVFVGGCALVGAALSPWADTAADRSLSVHMLQHLALTMVAAPLLVVGAPTAWILRSLPRRVGRRLVRLVNPVVAWAVFVGTQWAAHFTGFYVLALDQGWAHALEHAFFLVTAFLFWWPVLGSPSRMYSFWRVAYLTLAMPALGAIGVVLDASDSARYPGHASLAEQHAAGALMWAAGSLLMVGALVFTAWEWLREEERRAVAREAYGR
jgi:cytochrome c oxidase assembly factor CtaG